MYFSCLMLRNLVPQPMSATEQRAADEQLGQIAANVSRTTRCIAERAHAVAALPVRSRQKARIFRNLDRGSRQAW
jgi:hypothetical protein